MWRLSYRHANQFGYGDEFEILRLERIEGRKHGFDCSRVNVVRQHDRARASLFKNASANYSRAGSLPVIRIHVPKNDLISEFIVDPMFLARRDRSVGWPEQSRANTGSAFNCVVSSPQLATNGFLRHLSKVGMRPAVVSNFVTFLSSPRNNLGMFRDVLADHEESCLNVVSGEQI